MYVATCFHFLQRISFPFNDELFLSVPECHALYPEYLYLCTDVDVIFLESETLHSNLLWNNQLLCLEWQMSGQKTGTVYAVHALWC